MGLSSELSCEAGSFCCCCLIPHRCFQLVVWGFLSPPWDCIAGSAAGTPAAALPTLLHNPPPCWVRLLPYCPPQSSSHHLAMSPLCPAAHLCLSYRSGWMCLLYLLGCQTSIQLHFLSILVIFVFKLLLSFWLCEKAQCVYLCLHVGWKFWKCKFLVPALDLQNLGKSSAVCITKSLLVTLIR